MLKRLAISLLTAMIIISLSGCAGTEAVNGGSVEEDIIEDAAPAEGGEEEITEEAEEQIPAEETADQEIIAGLGRDPGIQYGYGAHPPLTKVLETLVVRDAQLQFKPELAETWDVSDDGLTWTFNLRKGVKFHDGSDFNAEDVEHNLLRVSASSPDLFGIMEEINIIDDYTIEVRHKEPFASFLYSVAWPGAAIISPDAIDAEGKVTEPVGTGPYKRTEWVTGEKMVLEKNEDYWGAEPILDKITLMNIPDATTRMLALEAGEIDMIIDTGGIIPEHAAMIEADPDIEVLTIDGAVPHYMPISTVREPFSDVRVRKAIMYAIDTESIVQYALEGYGKVMTSIIPDSESEWLHPDELYGFDQPEKAIELLGEAGWTDTDQDGILDKNGERFVATFLLSTSLIGRWPYLTIAEIIQDQLGDIGIIVEIKVVEGGLWNEILVEKGADFTLRPYAGISPQSRLYSWLHSEGDQNIATGIYFDDPDMDSAIELLLRTTDEDAARELFYEIQEMAAEEVSVIPVYDEVLINAVRSNVKGYRPHPWFYVNWEEIYIESISE
jgi:peptide/nickel transport system substrate-binding protein